MLRCKRQTYELCKEELNMALYNEWERVRDECDPEATNFVWWDCDLAWSVRDSIHVGFHPAPTGIAGLTIYLAQARGQVVGWGGGVGEGWSEH